jgi:hypothetical protein
MSGYGPIRAIGIGWYSRQNYRRILEVMEDADKLPPKFDQWLRRAEATERELKKAGHIVVRAMIEPEEFLAWCRARGLNVDAKARTQWGNEYAYQQVKNTH